MEDIYQRVTEVLIYGLYAESSATFPDWFCKVGDILQSNGIFVSKYSIENR